MVVKYYQNKGEFREPELVVEDNWTGDEKSILDAMYRRYNADDRPDGKIRRSMSVGDIVSVNGNAYVCGSFGWTRL